MNSGPRACRSNERFRMKILGLVVFVFACPLLVLGQGAIFDTTRLGVLAGSGFAAHVAYCQTILPTSGGTCDGSYEPAQMLPSTGITISSSNVVVILPPVTLTLTGGGVLAVGTALSPVSNSGFLCQQKWSCVLDASSNNPTGTISILGGNGDFADGIKMIGGRLNKLLGSDVVMTGTNHRFTNNWSVNAGRTAVALTDCNSCVVHYNVIDQSGAAAILANSDANGSTSNYNDIGFNLTRDANVNVSSAGQTANTQGTIGASCSAPACSGSPMAPTAHQADYNNIHDNVILNQVFTVGANCNNPNIGGTTGVAVNHWVSSGGGTTVTLTYTTADR